MLISPFYLQVDASDVQVGAVLSQANEENMGHPVATSVGNYFL